MRRRGLVAVLALLFGCGLLAPTVARADDPDFLTISGGYFDFNRQKDDGGEFRVEYRSDYKLWLFKPFVTGAVATNGMTFFGAGILMDVYFGRRWVLTPSFAPTWWRGATNNLDLGYALEFRSQLELAYRFDNRSRLGFSISHTSNASLGDTNPGTESLLLNYSVPIGMFAKIFEQEDGVPFPWEVRGYKALSLCYDRLNRAPVAQSDRAQDS